MMNEMQKKMADRMGLNENDLRGQKISNRELALAVEKNAEASALDKLEIEMAIAELAEIITAKN